MKDSELTRDEKEILEKYKPICRLLSTIDTIEHQLQLAEDREDIERILSDLAYHAPDLIEEFNAWIQKAERIEYEAKNFDFTNQQELDRQEFYNDHIHGCY